jgi:hypothetical protein
VAINAHYGTFSVYLTEADDPGNEIFIPISLWQLNAACEYIPATPSGSGDGTLLLPVIGTATWSAMFPLQENFPVSEDAFIEGAVIYKAFFGLGDGEQYEIIERTTLTSIQVINNNTGDVVRIVMTGMGGRVEHGGS